jgi:hypothetical protein
MFPKFVSLYLCLYSGLVHYLFIASGQPTNHIWLSDYMGDHIIGLEERNGSVTDVLDEWKENRRYYFDVSVFKCKVN